MEFLKAVAPLLGPAIALCGAVWLYFRKLRDDRSETARSKRAVLYDEYINAINEALQRSGGKSLVQTSLDIANSVLPIHGRISVLAPAKVVDGSFEYIKTLVEIRGTSYQKLTKDVTDHLTLVAHLEMNRRLGNARQKLINAFREDVYPGADELPKSMEIFDAEGDSLLTKLSQGLAGYLDSESTSAKPK